MAQDQRPEPGIFNEEWTPGDHVQSVYRQERAAGQAIPATITTHDYRHLGDDDIPTERYFSPEYHRREIEHMWKRVWQIACRIEDVPRVGDHYLYEIGDASILIVRASADEIKAYYNSCLHRATLLRTAPTGTGPTIRCPFHGWTWNLDGTIKTIPGDWDFKYLNQSPSKLCLPEAKVDFWGGFVFVNLDENCSDLKSYLEVLPQHFEDAGWSLENATKVAHVAAVVKANWKVFVESVQEAYHGPCTHPQLTPYYSGGETQYDVYGPHVDRMIALNAVPHPALRGTLSEQEIVDAMINDMGWEAGNVTVGEGQTARSVMTDLARQAIASATGLPLDTEPTASILDNIAYTLFPHTLLCGGYNYPVVARARPNGNNPDECIVEVYILAHRDPKLPAPPSAKINWIDSSDWTAAPELGALGRIYNQDVGNMERMQKGMKASKKGAISLASYMEVRIRHLHQTLESYLAGAN